MTFVDEAKIFIKGGDGGQGCESFYRDKYMRYPRPDGGDGGRGGNMVFIADRSVRTLLDFRFKQHYQAPKGGNASSNGKTGKTGRDCYLKVPIGTILRDWTTGLTIRDLVKDQQSVIVASGGTGGLGNINKKIPTLPSKGEELTVGLELKLIADVGLVGFPNAGKSTLISNISRVKSKIANYPFTTKHPILGFVMHEDNEFIIADLPGIIEGAHKGKGLGDRFLRHAERTKILAHVIDMAATEGRDPLEDYEKINHELREYSDALTFKHKIVVANKMDLPEAQNHLKRFQAKYKEKIIAISSLEKQGLTKFIETIIPILCQDSSPEQ